MYYKLTNQKMQTYHGFQWTLGKWYKIPKRNRGWGLCSRSWFHCYNDPLLAVLLNPKHANIENPLLFVCEIRGYIATECGLKFGFTEMKLTKEIPVPVITDTQRIAFGILCAQKVYKEPGWNLWADNWLLGKDRSKEATEKTWVDGNAHSAAAAVYAARVEVESIKCVAASAATYAAYIDNIDLPAIAKEAMKY